MVRVSDLCLRSPFCARVKRICLGERVNFLKSNPIHQRVPVLLHKGKPIVKYAIIVSYTDEVWPSKPLLPVGAYDHAQGRF
ncbi:hypothetical protein VNO80_13424 [Phaseolus coccineus]|uniref:GST N-terminal domain-containing protein n=1 Tax=Phaseolus coccineus TaxID=3886 RepID=A0AAN9RFM0_PHACN